MVFVTLAALLVVMPVPFVAWSPGRVHDTLGSLNSQPMIRVEGTRSFPTTGELDITTLSVTRADSRLTLPEAVLAYWLPNRDALPRDVVYPPGKSAAEVESEEADMMATAQDDAVVAALRAAGQPVTEHPAIASVTVRGPSHRRLMPGDLVLAVDNVSVRTGDQVGELIRRHPVGDVVSFRVLRDDRQTTVGVRTAASPDAQRRPAVGITVGPGYDYVPDISFDLGHRIGGPSAGLIFATAIYDKITEGPLLSGAHIAGTGSITPAGVVGPIGGIQQKIAAADKAGASAFLVPSGNCARAADVHTDMTLIKISTLQEGIDALNQLRQPDGASRVPRC
ncbi:MAG TPA: S16 family serine protease [Dermatophilaceae bacterium]|nr:S16 family serine protease [Dermatophilaceae bacterium]